MKAIAKDRTERFATMREFDAALRAFADAAAMDDAVSALESTRKEVEQLQLSEQYNTQFIGRPATLMEMTMTQARGVWPATATEVIQVVLCVRSGPADIGREYELSKTVTRIGRGSDNVFVLNDQKLALPCQYRTQSGRLGAPGPEHRERDTRQWSPRKGKGGPAPTRQDFAG
jgi:hypothetical protein